MGRSIVVDLFAGAGGFSHGFALAGADPVLAIESDRWACDTYEHNHPNSNVLCADITKVEVEQVTGMLEGKTADVVIGGPPCQGYSIANKNSGDPKDPRNSLFMEYVRLAHSLSPKAMVIENVPNLVRAKTASGKPVLEVIKDTLEELGYHFYSNILLATDYGVPQIRRRLFCIASRKELEHPFPKPTHYVPVASGQEDLLSQFGNLPKCPTLWDAISDLPPLSASEGSEEQPYSDSAQTEFQRWARKGSNKLFNHKAMNHGKRMVERFQAMKWGESGNDVPMHLRPRKRNSLEISTTAYDQNNRRMSANVPCHTIAASFYANFVHPYQHRNFTAREGARIQSFPDTYRFLGKPTVVSHKLLGREDRTDELFLCQYNQVGNAVPPLMAKAVAANLLAQL